MTRDLFLRALRGGLRGLPPGDIDDIVADYTAYFDEARASGRREEDVAAALGDPKRLARELRAETGLRRWENQRSLGNFIAALLALGGLATVDLFVLLPLLLALGLATMVIGIVIVAFFVAGLATLLSALLSAALAGILTGIGFVAGSVGSGALLLLALTGAVRLLGHYARLHYRLLKPTPNAA
jgi:uncharacterized membrane protein